MCSVGTVSSIKTHSPTIFSLFHVVPAARMLRTVAHHRRCLLRTIRTFCFRFLRGCRIHFVVIEQV